MEHHHHAKYHFDRDAFFRAIILLGFAALTIWLSNTNQLALYINPRFNDFVELSSFLLFPLGVIQLLIVIRPTHEHEHRHTNRLSYLPFLAVLGLAFMVPGNMLSANLVGNKGLNRAINVATPAPSSVSAPAIYRPLAAKLHQAQRIEVTDRDYTEIISELELFPTDYLDKKITLTGFVFRPPGITSSQFSLVRYVIVCCAADARPYGVLCELNNAAQYPDGTWLTISGVIENSRYDGKVVAAVNIKSLKQVEIPAAPYVFPFSQ
ncbi:MAG: hypothetical protein H6Q74_3125 [Firmicutes bacterium]|nr:hypothetical protein [Bacillota bacterium]